MTDHKAFFERLADNRIALVDKFGIDYGGCYCTVEDLYQAFKSRYEEERKPKQFSEFQASKWSQCGNHTYENGYCANCGFRAPEESGHE